MSLPNANYVNTNPTGPNHAYNQEQRALYEATLKYWQGQSLDTRRQEATDKQSQYRQGKLKGTEAEIKLDALIDSINLPTPPKYPSPFPDPSTYPGPGGPM